MNRFSFRVKRIAVVCLFTAFLIAYIIWGPLSNETSGRAGKFTYHETTLRGVQTTNPYHNDFTTKESRVTDKHLHVKRADVRTFTYKEKHLNENTPNNGFNQTQLSLLTKPTLLWWVPVYGMTDHDAVCDHLLCSVSVNRSNLDKPQTQGLLFYAPQFDLTDLPIPRRQHQIWALEHNESPKNNEFIFSHNAVMSLFNYTSTFKRQSDYPISTQYLPSLKWLVEDKWMVPVSEKNNLRQQLAPVLFIHSDCNVPSDRESYLRLLQKYIQVDSYGACSNNKKLPENLRFKDDDMSALHKEEFLKFVAQYKFTLAMENAVCDDYITEKLWRTFHVGSVPIVFGSPKVKDFLPSNKSALVINDFSDVKDLAAYISYLDKNDEEYEQYLKYKNGISNRYLADTLRLRDWGEIEYHKTTKKKKYYSHYQGFECFVCKQVHNTLNSMRLQKAVKPSIAQLEHYGCPKPGQFDSKGQYIVTNADSGYGKLWLNAKYKGQAFRHFYDRGIKSSDLDIVNYAKRAYNRTL